MFSIDQLIGLDFETYGGTDLPTYGLHNYVNCPTFQPLIGSTAEFDSTWGTYRKKRFRFFNRDAAVELARLKRRIGDRYIVAHNALFEKAVLDAMGLHYPAERFIDSAVIARAMGAAGKLEAAAPQLLAVDKMEQGQRLIKMFAIPGKLQEENESLEFDPRIIELNPVDWDTFGDYCDLDAELGLRIAHQYLDRLPEKELGYQHITMEMNETGWPVDVPTVEEMQRRYLENQEAALQNFRDQHGAHDLNLNSLKQMKEWCQARGIRATSFDEKHVEKLHARISKKLQEVWMPSGRHQNYTEVLHLLETKQILGGSSLKKLQVLLNTVGSDHRLRDQYIHIGAAQSWRTTGRSVQMQNLKRLDGENIANMEELEDLDVEWDNTKLAENIRQTFTSSHPDGQVVVGDFKSVESRGLAWLAGATKKLLAYEMGRDMYKVQACLIYPGLAYDDVTKEQRQTGKVGELSCGYGAGGGAVQSFAAGMGVELSEGEAGKLVSDWRGANPEVVNLWSDLDLVLEQAVDDDLTGSIRVGPKKDYQVRIYPTVTPDSLKAIHPGAKSLCLELLDPKMHVIMRRYFHGVYRRGRGFCYYKPTERKTGDVWKAHYQDPKTKQTKFYNLYGGKITGILTQSFCREIFFSSLSRISAWVKALDNLDLIGQFHDEIVLDWRPPDLTQEAGQIDLEGVILGMNLLMSDAGDIRDFPLEADIKHDHRYTK